MLSSPTSPKISVIIPAKNEATLLGFCLDAIKKQSYPKNCFEIILVDNGSIDETVQIAKTFDCLVLDGSGLTIAGLRNLGVKFSTGEILAFLDADCVPEENWLQQILLRLLSKNCITGSRCDIPIKNPTWIEQAWYANRQNQTIEVGYINSGNLAVFKNDFEKIGGFNEKLETGEDSEFCFRAKKYLPIISDSSIRVVHLGNPKTVLQFFKRELWHGKNATASLKWKLLNKPLLGALSLFFLTTLQVIFICSNQFFLFLSASFCILLQLLLSSLKNIAKKSSKTILGRMCLFYIYYWARFFALIRFWLHLK
jgi:glycosyltransferase involved in cell wall biosynthesis